MISRYRLRKLLAPTAGFRRALAVTMLGLASFLAGTALSFRAVLLPVLDILSRAATRLVGQFVPPDSREMATHLLGGAFLLLGFYLMFLGARLALRHLIATLNPRLRSPMAEVYWRRQQRDQGPNIVALGGGTGLSTLLRGLKQHSSNITAIVTVTDDGGSSGRLSQDFGILPPGDLRNCLVALAEAEQAMTDLFQYRFTEQGSFSGHSLGNVLIYALTRQAGGDFERALEIASEVLNISGRVMPSTLDRVRLRAIMEDGSEIVGESAIVDSRKRIRRIFLDPESVRPFEQALEAIAEADLICIGPGSVYTSVIPNLLVPGVAKAIRQSKAVKAYVCNVMTQPGESDSFTASEHVIAIQANVEGRLFDYVVTNVARPSEALLRKYESSNQHFVEPDIDRIRGLGFKVITGDFMNETDVVRHDPFRVAAKLMRLVEG